MQISTSSSFALAVYKYRRADKSLAQPWKEISYSDQELLLFLCLQVGDVPLPMTCEMTIGMTMSMDTHIYRGADKSLARPGRKQATFSVRMA